jgi:hypothetical protein
MDDDIAGALLDALAVTNRKLGTIEELLMQLLENAKEISFHTSRIGDD